MPVSLARCCTLWAGGAEGVKSAAGGSGPRCGPVARGKGPRRRRLPAQRAPNIRRPTSTNERQRSRRAWLKAGSKHAGPERPARWPARPKGLRLRGTTSLVRGRRGELRRFARGRQAAVHSKSNWLLWSDERHLSGSTLALACSARETGLRGKGRLAALALTKLCDTQGSGEAR